MNQPIKNTPENGDVLDTQALTTDIVHFLYTNKAQNLVAIDVRGKVSYADFIIIATGASPRHVHSLGQQVATYVKKEYQIWAIGTEGLQIGEWGLLDFGDVVVHIFEPTTREDYELEKLWPDADRLDLKLSSKEG